MVWGKIGKRIGSILLPVIFWLAVWQLAAWLIEYKVQGRGNELLLPYPKTVAQALWRLCGQTSFWGNLAQSLWRVLKGMAWGLVFGGVLAVLTCRLTVADRLLSPAIRVIRATPVASFILLVLLWTVRTNVPVVIAALMVLTVVWENLSRGIRAVDPKLLEMAKCCRFSPVKTVVLVYLPSLKPFFAAALTNAIGLAWKSAVAAEVLCLPLKALGTQIYYSKLYLEIPDLFAWTVAVVTLSLILEKTLLWALTPRKRRG